jgi:adenosylmethionine-8-amino-7-oxononanoate aminotransferase
MKLWHPYTQAALDPAPIRIVRGEGPFLYTDDGRRLIDAISSWWVTIHGHAHPQIADAIGRQARTLEQVIFAGFTHEPAEELSGRLRKVLPQQLNRIFFSDDGSTAVEVALKMALQYWQNRGQPERSKIVALEHAYHGDTAGAMSVSDDSPFTQAFQAIRFPVLRSHSAYCYHCPVGRKRETCQIECLDRLRGLLESQHRNIAAILVEPLVQGAAGMIIHPVDFLRGIRRMASDFQIPLIADEVFTGFGRTGAMFACELADVIPDIMCLSKGLTGGFLPLAATVCTEEIYAPFHAPDRSRTLFHGHSFTANPLGCAAANASLQIFDDEPVLERIRTIAAIHRERLQQLANHPMVGEVRGLGDIGVVELKAGDPGYFSDIRNRLYSFFIDRGVLLRPLGNIIYVMPPYVISPQDLHTIYDVVADALTRFAG